MSVSRPSSDRASSPTDDGVSSILVPGRTCWRIEKARRAATVVDAASYYAALHEALRNARHSVLVIGWDLNHRIRLGRSKAGSPAGLTLGRQLRGLAKARPSLQIRVLKWNSPVTFELKRRTIPISILNWLSGPRVHFRLDGNHPATACQHQKLVVIDDALAFCGGIDLTDSRWDTRQHLDDDPRRRTPDGKPYVPFHDMMLAVDAAAARALGDLARERWRQATGEHPSPPPTGNDPWPESLEADFEDVSVGIARTEPLWNDGPEVREVEALCLAAIGAARRTIYIENQHFASRAIYEALHAVLDRADGPEVVVINPCECPGWVEEAVMGEARVKIVNRLRQADRSRRFGIYTPQTAGGHAIVVHAKCMIIDDRLVRIGSSNINNRSMGFDSECDVAIEAAPQDASVLNRIAAFRNSLLAEHLGVPVERFAAALASADSLLNAVESLRAPSGRTLMPLIIPPDDDPDQDITDSILDPEHTGRMPI